MRCCSKQKATQSTECYSLTVVRAVDTMHATAVGFKGALWQFSEKAWNASDTQGHPLTNIFQEKVAFTMPCSNRATGNQMLLMWNNCTKAFVLTWLTDRMARTLPWAPHLGDHYIGRVVSISATRWNHHPINDNISQLLPMSLLSHNV